MKKRDLTEKDRISIINYIYEGFTTPEIMTKFRNLYTHQQIAALRAHETMNSPNYGGSVKKKDLNILTDLARVKIIEQVKNGRSTPQIMKSLRGKYTKQQIAAVRAHVTMDNY